MTKAETLEYKEAVREQLKDKSCPYPYPYPYPYSYPSA